MPGECHQAARLLRHRAELSLEQEAVQPGEIILQPVLAIFLDEEAGVGQPRPQHPLVALAHRRQVAGIAVSHGQEIRQEAPSCVLDGKVLLMVLHHRHEHGRREREELTIECAAQCLRVLGAHDQLVQQRWVQHRDAAHLLGQRGRLLNNHPPAFILIDDHTGRLQNLQVRLRAGDRPWPAPQNAVTSGSAPGPHPRHLHAQDGSPQERHHPPDRPGEPCLALAPPHRLGKRQPGDHPGECPGEHLGAVLRALFDHCDRVPFALHLACLKPLHRHALSPGKSDRGLGGTALGIKCRLGGRTADLAHHRTLARSHTHAHHGQPAGSAVGPNDPGVDAQRGQGRAHPLGKLLQRRRNVVGRKLLSPDFKKQVRHAPLLPCLRPDGPCPASGSRRCAAMETLAPHVWPHNVRRSGAPAAGSGP